MISRNKGRFELSLWIVVCVAYLNILYRQLLVTYYVNQSYAVANLLPLPLRMSNVFLWVANHPNRIHNAQYMNGQISVCLFMLLSITQVVQFIKLPRLITITYLILCSFCSFLRNNYVCSPIIYRSVNQITTVLVQQCKLMIQFLHQFLKVLSIRKAELTCAEIPCSRVFRKLSSLSDLLAFWLAQNA